MMSLGFERGDKIAILGGNDPEWYWGEIAAQAAGGAAAGIFVDSLPPEIKHIVDHSDAKFVLAEDQEQVDKVLKLKGELPKVKKVFYWNPKGLWNYDDPILMTFKQVQELGREYEKTHPGVFEQSIAQGKADDLGVLCYTSGTTGLPKGAMLSHANVTHCSNVLKRIDRFSERDEYVSYISPAWALEQFVGIASGLDCAMTVSFPEEPETVQEDTRDIGPHVLFYSSRLWENLAAQIQVKIADTTRLNRLLYSLSLRMGYKMTNFWERNEKPPVYWRALHKLADFLVLRPLRDRIGLARTRITYSTGATLSSDVVRFFYSIGIKLSNIYGATESGPIATTWGEGVNFEAVGRPVEGAQVRISEDGEILAQSNGVFQGYYKNPEATAEKLRDGWYHTGDAGHITEDGYLIYWDRIKELLELADGTKFAPQYVESRLRFSPYIRDVMAIGGKKRPYITAIINIDFENVGKWAESRNIPYTTFVDLVQKPQVRGLIQKEVERLNRVLPEGVNIKRFINFHKEFDADEAELTRTRKLKRGLMEERYQGLINSMYEDKEKFTIEAEVRYQDGRKRVTATEIAINSLE
jgi:long-chain acyl-CoA synthetase